MKSLILALLISLLSACTLPQTTVRTGASAPSLIVTGAPSDATLYVDGLSMGAANQFDGNPKKLAVLEGVHLVEVRQGTAVLYRDKVFVGNGETHTIAVLPGAE